MSNPPRFPTDFDNTAEVTDYAKAVGITFGGFVLASFILSLAMIIACCCFNRKPKQSASFNKLIHLIIAVFIMAIAVIACGVGWGYNATSDKGVKQMTGSAGNLLGGSVGVVVALQGALSGLNSNLTQTIGHIVTELNAVTPQTYTYPIDNVVGAIDSMTASTNELNATATDIIVRNDNLRFEIQRLNNYSISPPSASDVPNINKEITDNIASGNASIAEMRVTTVEAKSRIGEALDEIVNNLIQVLGDNQATYSTQIDQASQSFDSTKKSITDIKDQYSSYETQINYYSTQRTMAVNGVMILPMVIGALGIIAVFFKFVVLLKITATLSFIFFLWYVLIAGVNYTLYVVSSGFCQSQDSIITSILNSVDTQYQAGNQTYSMSSAISDLLKCSGDNTFIRVFHSQYVIDDLQSLIQTKVNEIKTQADNVNFDNDFADATQSLADYTSKTNNIDFSKGANLTQIDVQLTVQKTDYENGRDANLTRVTNDLNTIQAASIRCGVACAPADTETFNTFDCRCMDSCTTADKDDACNAYANGMPSWVSVYVVVPALNNSVNDVRGVEAGIDNANFISLQITNATRNISNNLDVTKTNAKKFVTDTTGLVLGIVGVVNNGITDLSGSTKCSFVGASYNDFSDGFCHKFGPSSQVIAAMMLLGATTLFFTVIHSCFAIHRIRASGDDVEDSKDSKVVSLEAR